MKLVSSRTSIQVAKDFTLAVKSGNEFYGVYADPTGQGKGMTQVVRVSQKTPRIPFVVLLPGDEKLSPVWQRVLYEDDFVAEYVSAQNVIVLPQSKLDGVSKIPLGLVGQHEMVHFSHAPTNGVAPGNYQEQLEEEINAYHYELDLLHQLGGERYRRVLQQEVRRVSRQVAPGNYTLRAPSYDLYAVDLDVVFDGAPISESEKQIRTTLVLMDGAFNFWESEGGSAAFGHEMDFMAAIYLAP